MLFVMSYMFCCFCLRALCVYMCSEKSPSRPRCDIWRLDSYHRGNRFTQLLLAMTRHHGVGYEDRRTWVLPGPKSFPNHPVPRRTQSPVFGNTSCRNNIGNASLSTLLRSISNTREFDHEPAGSCRGVVFCRVPLCGSRIRARRNPLCSIV